MGRRLRRGVDDGPTAELLNTERRREWDKFHAATLLSKFTRAAIRFAPWMLKALAALSETHAGGRWLFDIVLKPAAGAALTLLFQARSLQQLVGLSSRQVAAGF